MRVTVSKPRRWRGWRVVGPWEKELARGGEQMGDLLLTINVGGCRR